MTPFLLMAVFIMAVASAPSVKRGAGPERDEEMRAVSAVCL
jgi:hypothetical protein